MTGKRRFWARLVLFGVLFALSFGGSLALRGAVLQNLPTGVVYTGGEIPFSAVEAASLGGEQKVSGVSRSAGYAASVTDPARGSSVDILRTDGTYRHVQPLKLAEGAFLTTDHSTMRNGQDAVISDSLAVALFAADRDIVGRRFLLNGTELQVVGVYKTRMDLLSRLGSDGRDTVYVPWYSDAAPSDTVQEVWIPTEDYVSRMYIHERLNGAVTWWKETDLTMQRALVFQRGSMLIFFAGYTAAAFLIWRLYRTVKRDVRYLRERIPNNAWWVKHGLFWAALTAGAVLLLLFTRFDLTLPYELTGANILRPGFYLEWFVSSVQTSRQSPIGAYIGTAAAAQTVLGVLSYVFLIHGLLCAGKGNHHCHNRTDDAE